MTSRILKIFTKQGVACDIFIPKPEIRCDSALLHIIMIKRNKTQPQIGQAATGKYEIQK